MGLHSDTRKVGGWGACKLSGSSLGCCRNWSGGWVEGGGISALPIFLRFIETLYGPQPALRELASGNDLLFRNNVLIHVTWEAGGEVGRGARGLEQTHLSTVLTAELTHGRAMALEEGAQLCLNL